MKDSNSVKSKVFIFVKIQNLSLIKCLFVDDEGVALLISVYL